MNGSKGRILVLFGSISLYGHERANIDDMEVLRERGWDILFVTHPNWGHQKIQPELERRGFAWTTATFAERFDRGINLRGYLRRFRDIVHGSWDLARLLKTYRPTHIHIGNLTWFVDFLPALLLTRTPVIYRLGDKPADHRAAFRFFWRFVVGPRVTHFLCVSRFVCARICALAHVEGKTSVVYCRPPLRRAPNVEERPRSSRRGLTFGYVGQISEEKGVAFLVESAIRICESHPNAQFLVAGGMESNEQFFCTQESRVRKAGFHERIRFLGYVEDVDGFYRDVDVHLCPSICDEALGLTVLEAKERGVPSVVFSSGGLPEIVQHGLDGMICAAKSSQALEAACAAYLEAPDLVASHGLEARASLARLGVQELADKLDEAYERTIFVR